MMTVTWVGRKEGGSGKTENVGSFLLNGFLFFLVADTSPETFLFVFVLSFLLRLLEEEGFQTLASVERRPYGKEKKKRRADKEKMVRRKCARVAVVADVQSAVIPRLYVWEEREAGRGTLLVFLYGLLG